MFEVHLFRNSLLKWAMWCCFAFTGIPSYANELASGPMPGYVGMREATIWLQTHSPASVQILYWPRDKASWRRLSNPVSVEASTDLTAQIHIRDLDPGTEYLYQVYVEGTEVTFDSDLVFHTQPFWQNRTAPPDFEVAVGSCTYINEAPFDRPGIPFGMGFEIFDAIADRKPAFMLWLGDQIYLRAADVYSSSGMAYRYRHMRSFPSLQRLLRSTHHVAIWDDHDYGPNNFNRSWIFKDVALDLFKQYWANPSYGLKELPGIFTVVSYGDVDFFLLDDRFYRDNDNNLDLPHKGMFGHDQLAWLQNALLASSATFKVVVGGSQFLDSQPEAEGWYHFPHERGAFLDWVKTAKPLGVLFLSGDRHFTKLLRYDLNVPYPLYELTCSPLTAGEGALSQEVPNPWVIQESQVGQRNFCTLSFQGEGGERALTIAVYDTHGTQLWSRTIFRSELE